MYLKSAENVITLTKLIGLLFLFCLPLLSILFLKTKRNDLARPVMGTIFPVYHLKSQLNTPNPQKFTWPAKTGYSSNYVRRRLGGFSQIRSHVIVINHMRGLYEINKSRDTRAKPEWQGFMNRVQTEHWFITIL